MANQRKRINRWVVEAGRQVNQTDWDRLTKVIDDLRDFAHRNSYAVLDYSIAQTGNLAATSTVIYQTTIPAKTLSRNGDSLMINTSYQFAANANNKSLELYLGPASNPIAGTRIFNTAALPINNQSLVLRSVLVRFSYNACVMDYSINSGYAPLAGTSSFGSAAEDWNTDLGLAAVGTGLLANDIKGFMWHLSYLPTSAQE